MMSEKLTEALNHPLWKNHVIGNTYTMDDKGEWKIVYYPIFECGKTGEEYSEPRALVETPAVFNGEKGTDFREVPLRYLELKSVWKDLQCPVVKNISPTTIGDKIEPMTNEQVKEEMGKMIKKLEDLTGRKVVIKSNGSPIKVMLPEEKNESNDKKN